MSDRSRQRWLAMIALILLLAITYAEISVGALRSRAEWVSLVNLIATPERFHGKLVMVTGFVSIAPEQNVICLARDVPSSKECLWLQLFDREVKTQADADEYDTAVDLWRAKYHGKVVAVTARFDMEDKGHLLSQSGTLREISVPSATRTRRENQSRKQASRK